MGLLSGGLIGGGKTGVLQYIINLHLEEKRVSSYFSLHGHVYDQLVIRLDLHGNPTYL